MNQSFYIGTLGASGQQENLNIVANNIANINTTAFKPKYSVFSDLVHEKIRNAEDEDSVTSGSGTKIDETKTDLSVMPYTTTNGEYDYAITGEGFFMLKDPVSGNISYTRDGSFQLSKVDDVYYLVNSEGKRVLNMDQEEITYDVDPYTYPGSEDEVDTDEEEDELEDGEHDPQAIGVYTFAVRDGMINSGNNEYTVSEKNGDPILLEDANVVSGALESSGSDFAVEMTRMIEAQRSYSYALKMVQTSDEIESTINSLR